MQAASSSRRQHKVSRSTRPRPWRWCMKCLWGAKTASTYRSSRNSPRLSCVLSLELSFVFQWGWRVRSVYWGGSCLR